MKYTGIVKSGRGYDVYQFVVGREEMRLMMEIFRETLKKIPHITETQIVRSRLQNMRRRTEAALKI